MDRDRCDLPVKIAIAILVLVTAAALAAVAVGVAGWLAGWPGRARTRVKPEPHRDRGPSVAVRGNADGACRPSELCSLTVLTARTPVRYASVDSAT